MKKGLVNVILSECAVYSKVWVRVCVRACDVRVCVRGYSGADRAYLG